MVVSPKISILGAAVLAIGFAGGFLTHNVFAGTSSTVSHNQVSTQTTPSFVLPKQTIHLPGNVMAYVIPKNEEAKYKDIKVSDSKGNQVTLDATKQPIFVMSYSNPDSIASLKMLENAGASPTVVSTGFIGNGTDLSTAISETKQTLQSAELTPKQLVYALYPVPLISAFPLLIMQYKGELVEVLGNLPNSPLWSQI